MSSAVISREDVTLYLNPDETDPARAARRDLFYLAFAKISSDATAFPTHSLQSLYAISGIHGEPYVEYDRSAEVSKPKAPQQWLGYCQHGSVLFPTWHRPYCLLIEKAIQRAAHVVAASLSDKAAQADAHARADELRLPFWSWGAPGLLDPDNPGYVLPVPLRAETVSLQHYKPQKSFPNPLLRYRYPETIVDNGQKVRVAGQQTLRNDWDTMEAWWTADSGGVYEQAMSAVADIMLTSDWALFSNHSAAPNGENSLEGVHDQIHGYMGGDVSGDMGNPNFAAFDPAFFFHHCNVDRLLAIWQVNNPTAWVTPGQTDVGTFALPERTKVDSSTPLAPFRMHILTDGAAQQTHVTNGAAAASQRFFTSDDCRDTRKLGYSYAGLDDDQPVFTAPLVQLNTATIKSGAFNARLGATAAAAAPAAAPATRPAASPASAPAVSTASASATTATATPAAKAAAVPAQVNVAVPQTTATVAPSTAGPVAATTVRTATNGQSVAAPTATNGQGVIEPLQSLAISCKPTQAGQAASHPAAAATAAHPSSAPAVTLPPAFYEAPRSTSNVVYVTTLSPSGSCHESGVRQGGFSTEGITISAPVSTGYGSKPAPYSGYTAPKTGYGTGSTAPTATYGTSGGAPITTTYGSSAPSTYDDRIVITEGGSSSYTSQGAYQQPAALVLPPTPTASTSTTVEPSGTGSVAARAWVVQFAHLPKMYFGGSYFVRVFINKPDADESTPISCNEYGGQVYVFARGEQVTCANCEQHSQIRLSLNITRALARLGLVDVHTHQLTGTVHVKAVLVGHHVKDLRGDERKDAQLNNDAGLFEAVVKQLSSGDSISSPNATPRPAGLTALVSHHPVAHHVEQRFELRHRADAPGSRELRSPASAAAGGPFHFTVAAQRHPNRMHVASNLQSTRPAAVAQ